PVRACLQPLNNRPAATALAAERTVVEALGGGCQLPLGAIAWPDGPSLHMQAIVASPDGRRIVKARASGPAPDPETLGRRVAEILTDEGARAILDDVRNPGIRD